MPLVDRWELQPIRRHVARGWAEIEEGILSAHGVGDYSQCTALAVKFGRQWIRAYLRKKLGDEALVDDAFAEWSELVAASWAQFDPSKSVSTWLYVLTRRPRAFAVKQIVRRAAESPVNGQEGAASSRRGTSPHVRTTVKDEFRTIWADLAPDDRELLRLRIEEGLSWDAVARSLRGSCWKPTDGELKRETMKLAARFKRKIKDFLTEQAQEKGLLKKYAVEP